MVKLAARAGLHLYPWQQLVLRDALGETAAGRWTAFEVGLVVPRQNGKGSILEALELGALFLADPDEPPPLILHSAHEFKTSAEHFRRVRDLVEGNELFARQVRIIRTASGAESIELHSGARLRFVTRSSGSGRGFSADLVVIDEAYNLTAESMAAILPTMSARPNPQVWYTSSAGMESSEQLARIRQRGSMGGDPSLAYFEWSAPDGSSLDDRAAWAQANPSLGYRIPESFIVTERAALPDEQFGRERLGLWADAAGTGAFPPGTWTATLDPTSSITGALTFGVDVSPDHSMASIGVCGYRADGVLHLEMVRNGPETGWIVPELAQIVARNGGSVAIDPASPAGSLIDELKRAGVLVHPLAARDYAQACGWLFDAVKGREVRHLAQPELDVAVAGARTRDLAGGFAWDRKRQASDITPLVAVTLACWGFRTFGSADPTEAVW